MNTNKQLKTTTNLIKRINELPPVLVDEIEEYMKDDVMNVRMKRYRWFVIAENAIWEQMALVRCRNEDEIIHENTYTCRKIVDIIQGYSFNLDSDINFSFTSFEEHLPDSGAVVVYYKTIEHNFYNEFSIIVNHGSETDYQFYDEEHTVSHQIGLELKAGIDSDPDRYTVHDVQVYGKKSTRSEIPNYLWTIDQGILPGSFDF